MSLKKTFVIGLLLALTACGTATKDDNPTQGMSPQQKRIWASP